MTNVAAMMVGVHSYFLDGDLSVICHYNEILINLIVVCFRTEWKKALTFLAGKMAR